jgi:CO dehydrogenase/acetyl-CoA synthase beta subunit
MELFSETLAGLSNYLAEAKARNSLRRYDYNLFSVWPDQSSLVLQEDTAVELGGAGGSLLMILWTGQKGLIRPGQISLIGPDLSETGAAKLPLTQVVAVKGRYADEYETYQDLQDVIFGIRLKGVATRFWPDRQKVWCRVSKEALREGFNLFSYGCTLIKKLEALPRVEGAEVIFATEMPHEKTLLTPVADKVQEIMEVLLKLYDQINFDCEICEYKEICAEVAGLKEIHRRLHEEREQI